MPCKFCGEKGLVVVGYQEPPDVGSRDICACSCPAGKWWRKNASVLLGYAQEHGFERYGKLEDFFTEAELANDGDPAVRVGSGERR